MRILTEIPDDDLEMLDALAKRRRKSRAAEIREAIRLHLTQNADNKDWIQRWAGLWEQRKEIGDGLEYQRAMRAGFRSEDTA